MARSQVVDRKNDIDYHRRCQKVAKELGRRCFGSTRNRGFSTDKGEQIPHVVLEYIEHICGTKRKKGVTMLENVYLVRIFVPDRLGGAEPVATNAIIRGESEADIRSRLGADFCDQMEIKFLCKVDSLMAGHIIIFPQ